MTDHILPQNPMLSQETALKVQQLLTEALLLLSREWTPPVEAPETDGTWRTRTLNTLTHVPAIKLDLTARVQTMNGGFGIVWTVSNQL